MNQMENGGTFPTLDGRLSAVAKLVRRHAYLADIGSDHGYLPIALCEEGIVSRAIAADIAEQPLAKAEANIREHGLAEQIETVLCDGVSALCDREITDLAICGMGGETISHILSCDCAFLHSARLILQPMTMQSHLRVWLSEHGYCTDYETVAYANKKYYPIICCHFDGMQRTLSPFDAVIGNILWERRNESTVICAYLHQKQTQISHIADGKRRAGISSHEEDSILARLSEIS